MKEHIYKYFLDFIHAKPVHYPIVYPSYYPLFPNEIVWILKAKKKGHGHYKMDMVDMKNCSTKVKFLTHGS